MFCYGDFALVKRKDTKKSAKSSNRQLFSSILSLFVY